MQLANLEEATQHAQDRFRGLSEQLESIDEDRADGLRAALEATEDAIDQADDATGADERFDALHRAAEYVQSAQDDLDALQQATGSDVSFGDELEALEDAVEDIEDSLSEQLDSDDRDERDELDGYEVTVSSETKILDQRLIEPIELLRAFDYDPNQYVLYPPDEDERVPKESEIDLAEDHVFDAIPVDTAYGSAQLDEVLATDIEVLREDYEVDVDTEAESKFVHVIVRDYPIPSSAYNKRSTDTMIRVHENYPQKAPDWVYVDEDLHLEGGGQLRKSRDDQVRGWLALSWHINNLDGVEWEPFETDLKWYLETIVSSRLRQGD
jgi:hypothetical protein